MAAQLGDQVVLAAGLPLEDHELAVARVGYPLELLDRPVEPAHEEQTQGHAVGNDERVVGEVRLFKVAVQGAKKVADPVVDVGARFALGDAVVKRAVGVAGRVGGGAGGQVAQVAPLLLAHARLLPPAHLLPDQGAGQVLERAAGAPHRRDVGKHGLVAHQRAQLLAGRGGLLLAAGREGQRVVGGAAVDGFVDVALRFGVADEDEAGGFHGTGAKQGGT